jgi:hypothetical protein
MMRHSCVIVGGGPAGIATALFLLDAAPSLGRRAIVLEKERYPREKICAGALGDRADRLLSTIGVAIDVPSTPVRALAFRAMGEVRIVREPRAGRVIRRVEFDQALARVAERRGIEVREGVRATSVDVTPGGVRVRTTEGDIEADVVVGADGVGSLVRRTAGVERTPYVAQAVEVDTGPVSGDLPRDVLAFDVSRRDLRGYYWEFPTLVEGRPLVSRGVYSLGLRDGERQPDVESVLGAELAARGLSLGSYGKRRYAERGFHRGKCFIELGFGDGERRREAEHAAAGDREQHAALADIGEERGVVEAGRHRQAAQEPEAARVCRCGQRGIRGECSQALPELVAHALGVLHQLLFVEDA